MKRYLAAALFLLIFGVLLTYIFHDRNTDGASVIRMGIAFILFGAIVFFDGRLLPRLRIFVKAMMLLIAWGLLAYSDFMNGDIGSALILGIVLTVVGILTLPQDTPLVKKKNTTLIRLRSTPYIRMIFSLVPLTVLLLWLSFKD